MSIIKMRYCSQACNFIVLVTALLLFFDILCRSLLLIELMLWQSWLAQAKFQVGLLLLLSDFAGFYRAMHFSAKRGIAIVYCPSVCLCVTFRYRDHIGWNSSKIISRLISLGSLLLGAPTSAMWFNGNTSNIGVGVKVRICHRLLIF